MNARKMIKAVILGIAAAAALSVSGCSDGNKAPDQGAVQKESPLMQKIKKQGKLVVGTASGYPPYEFIDTSVGGMLIGMICQIFIVPALFVIFQYLQEKVKPMEWEDIDNADAVTEIEQYAK